MESNLIPHEDKLTAFLNNEKLPGNAQEVLQLS